MNTRHEELLDDVLEGDHAALARAITVIENRQPGCENLVSSFHHHSGAAEVIGVTGSPGVGKSTLVDKLVEQYREQGESVGVIAVDPSSPFTGGAILGDRIRLSSTLGDMDVFFRSMSARGTLGGLSMATMDAVKALDAFGKDKIIIETVGAGQNEIDVVRTADTVAVLLAPSSGDDVQMLKAGILEIADVFVVNKADLDGVDRTVTELRELVTREEKFQEIADHPAHEDRHNVWTPPIVETVAKRGDGISELLKALDEHDSFLMASGKHKDNAHERAAEEIKNRVRTELTDIATEAIEEQGGIEDLAAVVAARERSPLDVVEDVLKPIHDRMGKHPN